MNKIGDNALINITGGTDITASFINSITNIFKLFMDIGIGLGSSIRRIAESNMCPLK